jgi:hypothetical protein
MRRRGCALHDHSLLYVVPCSNVSLTHHTLRKRLQWLGTWTFFFLVQIHGKGLKSCRPPNDTLSRVVDRSHMAGSRWSLIVTVRIGRLPPCNHADRVLPAHDMPSKDHDSLELSTDQRMTALKGLKHEPQAAMKWHPSRLYL